MKNMLQKWHGIGPLLSAQLEIQVAQCVECRLCRKKCLFLQKYGSPKQIASSYDPLSEKDLVMAYECSLCGLCAAVCPVRIDPAKMFLEMRRECVSRGLTDFSRYKKLLGYEKLGTSKVFSYHGLPQECSTVLFPGCALSGSRAHLVKKLFNQLKKTIPSLGIVLDCCTKPSHDLGRQEFFHSSFDVLKRSLLSRGVKKILVACPSCFKVFQQYGEGLETSFVYEYLPGQSSVAFVDHSIEVKIHDPCSSRTEKNLHATIRKLVLEKSISVTEFENQGDKTLCCGEGGAVCHSNKEIAGNWGKYRRKEAGGGMIITYCAGCAHFLNTVNPTSHILDLYFQPNATLKGKNKVSRNPWTYFNRLLLKRYFRKNIDSENR